MTRRTAFAAGPWALAAALAVAGCSATPPLEEAQLSPLPVDTGLRSQIGDAQAVTVGGERLNAGLLRRFYALRDFQPVWASHPAQADILLDVVAHAGDHGLDPALYHIGRLSDGSAFTPMERELVLSDAVLGYASALAHGAVPVSRRKDGEALTPGPIDVAGVLHGALDGGDPAEAITALAPTTPSYLALCEALRQARSGPAADRLRTIQVNLERQRWLPRQMPADRAWVNVADERLVLYRADQPVFTTRVVVGEDVERNQSPEFRATIDASFYNPPWVVPADIAAREILPRLGRDPNYLARNKMVLLAGGEVEQAPGPDAGLGFIMFDMPNRFDVYLHDTPDRYIFSRENRRISHGCIRVQAPRDFAALLMDQPVAAIDEGIAGGSTTRNALPAPMPVFVVYQTAFADAAGALQFRPDFYRRDAAIWRSLQEAPQGRDFAEPGLPA